MPRIFILVACFLAAWPAWGMGIALSIGDIAAPGLRVRAISAELPLDWSRLEARIGEISFQDRTWRNVRLTCPALTVGSKEILCTRGTLFAGGAVPVSFRYGTADKSFDLALLPAAREAWRITGNPGRSGWHVRLAVENGQAARLTAFFPADAPKFSAGTISGTLDWDGARLAANLKLNGVAFSDASGLHAGDKLGAALLVTVAKQGTQWRWQATMDWQQGEVFWQPLYFAKGGHRLRAHGSLDAASFGVEEGTLSLAGIGAARIAGRWDRTRGRLTDFELDGRDLNLAELYAVLLKPFLEKTALAQARAGGQADLAWRYVNGATERFDLGLRAASFKDDERRFAVEGVEARIPWRRDAPAQADIRIASGSLYHLPLGATHIPLRMNGLRFDIEKLETPLLDGKLSLENFHAEKLAGDWQWQFAGALAPVSMQRFTQALGLTPMHGTLSGVIPRVSYSQENLTVDGALLFKVFDGTAVVKNLSLIEPFGPAPRLAADIDMRRLDLDLLTRTFSFGNMQGLIDVEVKGLELSNWKPVAFDASVMSSPGDYPRKISQTAVQNISALGGAGAAAAIQRSFLSFFEQFGYDKIGLSCRLRNGVCVMDGVAEAPQGYVIVKGGGIPAISVIGYNRYVSWQELLDRLARVTQTNVKPIVQ